MNRRLTIRRKLPAPREAVFRAWTDPVELAWFADQPPRIPTTVDLRVGGAWRLHMIQSDAREYITGGIYHEIVPPERLVFTWGAVGGWPSIDPDDPGNAPVATVMLSESDGATEMVFTLDFPARFSDDEVQVWYGLGVVHGWNATLDRLSPHLEKNGEH